MVLFREAGRRDRAQGAARTRPRKAQGLLRKEIKVYGMNVRVLGWGLRVEVRRLEPQG